jgi:hypothetical protein
MTEEEEELPIFKKSNKSSVRLREEERKGDGTQQMPRARKRLRKIHPQVGRFCY